MVPEEIERETHTQNIFKQIIAGNFPHLGKDAGIQVQDLERTPFKINKNRSTPQQIVVKPANFQRQRENPEIISRQKVPNLQAWLH